MPRPKSEIKTYSVELTPADAELARRIAAARGLLSERGTPSRSAAIRELIREAGKKLEQKAKKTEKSEA